MRSLFADHPVSFNVARAFDCYRAYVRTVTDGDTVTVVADLGLLSFTYCALRIKDVHAPEIVGADAAAGKAWKDALTKLMRRRREVTNLGYPVLVRTEKGDKKTFERFVATIYTTEKKDVGAMLCAKMGVTYPMRA